MTLARCACQARIATYMHFVDTDTSHARMYCKHRLVSASVMGCVPMLMTVVCPSVEVPARLLYLTRATSVNLLG